MSKAGQFSVANGQIVDPSGSPFVERGINVFTNQVDAATILKTFPGINAVRLATTPDADPNAIDALVQGLTSAGVVVVIEDHSSSRGNPNTLSGQALADQAAWYGRETAKYQNNPRVWFGTPNEPDNSANLKAITDQERAVYDAIRGAGSQAMIMLEERGGGWSTDATVQNASTFADMTNVAWDVHYYGGETNGNQDPSVLAKAIQAHVDGSRVVRSADGVVPVVIGEYGPSTTGSGGYDNNGLQVVQAVDNSGLSSFAWAYNAGTDALTSDSGNLTDFGQMVAKHIAAGGAASPLAASSLSAPVPSVTTPAAPNVTAASKLTTTLPVSPMIPAGNGPAAQAGIVQINLGTDTGQVVTGGEFGLATTMGTPNWSYASYADPTFQALANQYPTDLLRHNWELNTLMDFMFPTRASASTPDYSHIDTYLNQQGNLKNFFNNQTATQIVTLGFPSWLNISDPADQALYATMVKGIAQHFIAAGEPINNYELVNEPDGHYSATDMANTFNVVAQTLKTVDPSYKLGGLTETYARQDDLQTFFKIAGQNIGFVSWHQYVTGDSSSKSSQQEVTDSMGVANAAQSVRAQMQAAGIPDSVPMFLGEYNLDGGDYSDPANGNMVGAIAAAATTYGMIHANVNMPMGALWDVQNDSAYSVFGSQGNYKIDSVGITLGDLTSYMPGYLVQTTMPSDTPGLVGYTTTDNQVFSTALIDTNLSQGYTVDLSKNGLPTTGLYRVEVSNANPQGIKTAITDLSHVSVAAGSLVIITDETPHSGTELNGTTSTAPPATITQTPTPTPPATATTPGNTDTGSSNPGGSTTPFATGTTPGNSTGSSNVTTTPPTLPLASGTTPGNIDTGTANPGGSTTPAVVGTASGDTTGGSGSDGTTTPPSTMPPSAETSPGDINTNPGGAVTPPIVGTGADTVILKLSEDAYQGDAQFTFSVDGRVVGPTQSVTALHSQGESETFTFKGDWAAGAHRFGVSFTNDKWDGTDATDRNLYIDGATYDGGEVENATELNRNSTVTFGTAPISDPPSPLVGTGQDFVTLNLSEDADGGDAQFTFTVDGKQVGPAQSVTALHGQGPSEAFTFRGDWSTGTHQFGVTFANGADGANRHLYLDGAAFDSNRVANATEVTSSKPATFSTAAIAGPPGQPIGAGQPVANAANASTASGGIPSSPAQTPDATIATIDKQTLAFGSGTQGMSFASPQNLTITGGPGADTVTAVSGTNRFIAGTGSMDITGGSGASDFILQAGGGKLTIEDFLASKGDAITVDKALQPGFKQASDGHGGTLLTFGANQGSIDLIRVPSITPSNVTFA